MNIFVTGACGYKGTVLVPKLLLAGHNVTAFDLMWFGNKLLPHDNLSVIQGDVRKIKDFSFEGFDAVIHLSSVANDPCGDLNPKLTWEISALATMLLAENAYKYNVSQFIYASSGSVYGIKEEAEVTEDLDLEPISEYNKTKMISERVLLSYQDKMSIQIVRPATVCGYSPRMRLDVAVNMLTMQALTNKKITVLGGEQTRPNIHMQDITDVYIHFLNDPTITGIYNAGFENMSIIAIAELIASKVPSEIVVTESNDPRSYRQNSDKLLATGFVNNFSVQHAIEEIMKKYSGGEIDDRDEYYTVKTMKNLGLN